MTITGTERRSLQNLLTGFDDRFEKLTEEIKRVVKKGDKVLNIGCGEGKIWQNYSKGLDIYGIDMSERNLMKASKYLKPTLGSAEDLPYESQSFDLVVAGEILEHLFEPNRTISEIDRVLKTGGSAIITFPNTGGIQFRLGIFLWGESPLLNFPNNTNHIRFFNARDIGKMIEGTNLKIKKVRGVGFLAFHKENFGYYIPVPRKIRTLGGDYFPGFSLGNIIVLSKSHSRKTNV
ncbi:methyltransferase domain-containing protein [Candidatus Woesebacteria bacterium]|nr:methyltransferase domain-containing protein [Candidatus Woesebacteria bacterium]